MEEVKDEEESTMNEGEAAVSIAHAKLLVDSGVHASDIGIITPYSAQVNYCMLSVFIGMYS
jgi:superfamily I DNA and/or RNA helicase